MVRTWWVLLAGAAVLGVTGLVGGAEPDARDPDQAAADIGLQVADALGRGQFYSVTKYFDKAMTGKMSPSQVEDAWRTAMKTMGEFQYVIGPRVRREEGNQRVDVVCRFGHEQVMGAVEVVVDGQQKVSSLAFKLLPTQPEWAPPPYASETKITDLELPVGRAPHVLKGVLTRPLATGPFPTLVIVPGYGPMDAEGTSGTVGTNKPMRDIAMGLASRGVAVFHYEKRTLAYPNSFSGEYTAADESVNDALEAVNMLTEMMVVDQSRLMVGGMGTSAALLPRIAQRDPRIRGLVIMGGYSRPLSAVLESQAAFLVTAGGPHNTATRDLLEHAAAAARKITDPKLKKDALIKLTGVDIVGSYLIGPAGVAIPGSYWLDLRDYHPAQAAAALNIPMLVLSGAKDYLAPQADTDGWQAALKDKPTVRFETFPFVNHYFIAQEGPPSPTEYLVSGHVDQPVIEAIAAWVRKPTVAPAP